MEHLESLIDRALDAVVGMDAAGRVIAWNRAAEQIFGWSHEEALGSSMGDLIVPPQHQDAHTRGLEHYNRTGEGPVLEQHIRITAMHRNGSEFPIELSIFALSDSNQGSIFYAFARSLASEEAYRREQEMRAREADTVMKIAQRLIEDISLEDFTQFCLKEVCQIAGLDAGHLYFVRDHGAAKVLMPSGMWYLSDERFGPVIAESAPLRFGPGQGLPGRAWISGEILALHNLVDNCGFIRREVFAKVGLTQGVALPVGHGGETHAVLEFFGTESSRLDPEILRMLKTVGSQIGAALRRKEAAENRETLRREMAHRVGNSLSVMSAIYRGCSRNAVSKEALDDAFLGRVAAMGEANRMAINEAENGVPLPELILNSVGILPVRDDVSLDVPTLTIRSEAVMPLSLVFNELATNALKYGTLGTHSRLHIIARSCQETDELKLDWLELRKNALDTLPQQPSREGFGSQLLRAMIEGRLGGRYVKRLDELGYHVRIHIPISQIYIGRDAPNRCS